jgi:polynucleotide 5'-kinase involved in rRNA processing
MYRNLLCSFAKQSGEDFGMGILTDIDWNSMRAYAQCTAVPPAPVRILRLGSLRVDSNGHELGEVRPWQV